jgi:hypothetical protein
MLRLYRQATTSPLSSSIPQTPKHKLPTKEAEAEATEASKKHKVKPRKKPKAECP